jgi:RNA polymerase sigma-70 factor (ECF subfamily)
MSKSGAEPSDQDLLRMVIQRLPGAWELFYERFHRLMVACARRVYAKYGVSYTPEDMEDLVATVCYNLVKGDFHKLRLYDPEKGYRLSSWVGLISSNTAHDTLRRRSPSHVRLDSEEGLNVEQLVGPAPDPLAGLARQEQMALLRKAVFELSDVDREFVRYYYGLKLDPESVAKRLGITVNTVYSRKNKIRNKLIKLVRRDLKRKELSKAKDQ